MANKNKIKGTYHEKWFEAWLNKLGLKAKRVPLSGALGGEYTGDLWVDALVGRRLVAEVKYRDASNFPSPFKVLDNRDLALYKRRRGHPQTLVILSGELFAELMENHNDKTTTT
jgi:hypothetical protein